MAKVLAAFFVCLAAVAYADEEPTLGAVARIEVLRHAQLAKTRAAEGVVLTPFTTDGCSGGMSASWSALAALMPGFETTFTTEPPWQACCVDHDRLYHVGGDDPTPEVSYRARLAADEALQSCVLSVGKEQGAELALQYGQSETRVARAFGFVADQMFAAVRAGGMPCSGLPWRWGYGWPQCW